METILKNDSWLLCKNDDSYVLYNDNEELIYSINCKELKELRVNVEGEIVFIDGAKPINGRFLSDGKISYRYIFDFSSLWIKSYETIPDLEYKEYGKRIEHGIDISMYDVKTMDYVYKQTLFFGHTGFNPVFYPYYAYYKLFDRQGKCTDYNLVAFPKFDSIEEVVIKLLPDANYQEIDCLRCTDIHFFDCIASTKDGHVYYSCIDKYDYHYLYTFRLKNSDYLSRFARKYANVKQFTPLILIGNNGRYGVFCEGSVVLPCEYKTIKIVDESYSLKWDEEEYNKIVFTPKRCLKVCADYTIFDTEGKVESIMSENGVLLDTWERYIAYLFNGWIKIFLYDSDLLNKEKTHYSDIIFGCCRLLQYSYLSYGNDNYLGKFRCYSDSNPLIDHYDSNVFFNLKLNIFSVLPTFRPQKTRHGYVYEDYTMMDALDGDSEAYWNID